MSPIKKVWIYDTEQFPNFHCATFIDRDDKYRVKSFIIYNNINDAVEYYRFLRNEVSGLIGFNNVNYDYPLIHLFMSVMSAFIDGDAPSTYDLNNLLYEESQRLVNEKYTAIPDWQVRIPQLDIYRIHHFDNKNKATSLKHIEIAIQFENVVDMPIEYDQYVTDELLPTILNYNLNDTRATDAFYRLTMDAIEMRKKLGAKYGLNFRNANDPKIGQEIFVSEIAKKKGWSIDYVKELRTYRHSINLGDCVLPYIKFNSKEFNTLLDKFKQTIIETTYKAFEYSIIYKGVKYDYGTGGIHACIEPGIYEADNEYMIYDIDVKSYYPNLAIKNNFYPQHFGEDFVTVYQELFNERLKAQAEGDKASNSGLKLALNGTYGKSNDQYSPLYDPMYTMQITINGQLLLSMLAENMVDSIKNITILQANTDGITVKTHRDSEARLLDICGQWEMLTGLTLEYASYKKMVIRDVNNYLAIDIKDKIKYKGVFEIIPMQNGAIAYNKNWSMRVVPKALEAYYVKGTPIEEFILNHRDIYDFCLSFRAHKGWDLYREYIQDYQKKKEKIQRTIRYYISEVGDTLIKEKVLRDAMDEEEHSKNIMLESGYSSTLFNKYVEKKWSDYRINYSYYIAEANKIKNAVYDGQLKLFG